MRSLLPLVVMLLAPLAVDAQEAIPASKAKPDEKLPLLWYDLRLCGIEGQGFTDTKAPYDRLPASAEGKVRPPVWSLSRDSAGLCARFITDATAIHARWTLTKANLAMPHMPATGVSGLDLYVRDEAGKWRWLAIGRPQAKSNTVQLVSIPAGKREYLLYLPLYNGVESVEIGIAKDSPLSTAIPRTKKPIVFYGTSITQGGCASRPGMVHTAILGRMLDVPVVNLGFSGNGRLEAEVGELLARIDASAYVLDCLPNLGPKEVAERAEPFVLALRKARPETPIVLVEDRTYANAFLVTSLRERNEGNRREFKAAFDRLKQAGVKGLHYLPGESLIGDDGEGTVDSSHPTDLGFLRQAEVMRPVLAGLPGIQ